MLDRVLCGDPWTESDAAHIVSQLCDALDYLHAPMRRLVHADVRVSANLKRLLFILKLLASSFSLITSESALQVENVMLAERTGELVKLMDMGSTFRVPRSGERSVLKLPRAQDDVWLEFRAPEVHSADPLAELSYALDVWALACLASLLYRSPLSVSQILTDPK